MQLMATILLRNGEVGCGLGIYDGDILIEGGKIVKILDRGHRIKGDKEIDCKGKLILPGFIDAHVHFRGGKESYKEDFETGSAAAVSGGVTTVLDMPNNKPPILSKKDLEAKRKLVKGKSYCNYGFFIGFDGRNFEEISLSKNIAGVKVYMCDSTGEMGVGAKSVEDLFKNQKKIIVVHAEDGNCVSKNEKSYLAESLEGRKINPSIHSKIHSSKCASMAVKAVCELAKKSGKKVHIAHLSTECELEIVNKYRKAKVDVTCEVSPHHLVLSENDYEHLGNLIKINPPVRSNNDLFAMWKGIKFGDIDIIATDHAPHALVEKELDYVRASAGVPELETLLPILLNVVNDEGLTVAEVVKLCCENPAKIFGLKGKGQIEEGFDADIVVVDMEKVKDVRGADLFTKCKWSPYEGMSFKGWPVMTFVGGQIVFKDGKIVGKKVGREVEFGG